LNNYIVTVAVTKAFVLCPLLEDRRCVTDSVYVLMTIDRMKQKHFQFMTKWVCRLQQFRVCRQPVPWLRCSNREIWCVKWITWGFYSAISY